jgi:hypothetical protein
MNFAFWRGGLRAFAQRLERGGDLPGAQTLMWMLPRWSTPPMSD